MATNTTAPYPPKPPKFYRITDDRSHVRFDENSGFDVGYSTKFVPWHARITAYSLRSHFDWDSSCDWRGLISVCGTEDKAYREYEWRRVANRRNITAFEIDTKKLKWEELTVGASTRIPVLVSNDYGCSDISTDRAIFLNDQVIFMRATDLISAFGIATAIKAEALWSAKDEWLALEWIPRDMITRMN